MQRMGKKFKKIKICGMKYPDNIKAITNLQPDFLGFIFYKESARFVEDIDAEILKSIPKSIQKVGVFVDEDLEIIIKKVEQYSLDMVQLHGKETPGFCELIRAKLPVVKAFGMDDDFDWNSLKLFESSCDYFLFDTKTILHGGSGKAFSWQSLENYNLKRPFFISGGIGTENIEAVLQINHKDFWGLDLNSKLEERAAFKNQTLTQKIINTIRNEKNFCSR